MTIGEKIKYFRTLHGFTQDQLIQATGLSISTLQKYESDERKPKPEQLLKISQALGISINVFMDFDIHTVSDLLSLIFKMNEQLDLNFNSQKDSDGNILPDTLTLSFGNPIINQKLSTYVAFLNKMADSEKEQYTQALQELENQLLDDNTDIQKAAPIKESSAPPSDEEPEDTINNNSNGMGLEIGSTRKGLHTKCKIIVHYKRTETSKL